ncbi:MAG: DUF554 domain-containing protein [Geitlerinemataceae cyanobacterium]
MDFWLRTSGTWINLTTVALGTVLGLTLGRYLTTQMQKTIAQGVGLVALWIGLQMAGALSEAGTARIDGAILGLIAIAVGGAIGEALDIEGRLARLGDRLRRSIGSGGRFTEGFVTASLLFCVGPMAVLGSIDNGISGDNTILVLKASMDGIASIVLGSIYGVGVGFSVLPVVVYQGSISLLAGLAASAFPDPTSDPRVLLLTGVGGLMVAGIGLNLLEVGKIRLGSFLPALAIAPLLQQLAASL